MQQSVAKAATRLAEMVHRAATPYAPLLVVTDGLHSYATAFGKVFRFPLPTGRPGRPRLLSWSQLVLVQQVKQKGLVRLSCRTREVFLWALFARLWRQVGSVVVSTSYIERLNATFHERLAVLSRCTRCLARQTATLEAALYLRGCVYNFCHVHRSLGALRTCGRTPAMAAGLARNVWSVSHLLSRKVPPECWHPPKHRGLLSKQERALLAEWGE